MWPRFTWSEVRVVGHYLGSLVLCSSLMYVIPFLTALAFAEWEPAARYLFMTGLCIVIGAGMRFLRVEPGRLNRQNAMVVTGLAWIVLALIAAIPLYLSGHYATVLDAVFDGVSGLTTTGATLIQDLDHLSNADNMLRFLMHLLGGLGLIVIALSLGLFGKQSGASLYASEGRSEHVVPNVVQTTQFLASITSVFIIVGAVVLATFMLLSGLEPARAVLQGLWLSLSAFVTGGFAPTSQSVMYYHSFPIEFVLMILMILGSINFVLHSEMWKGHIQVFFRDLETRTFVVWICAMVFVFTASLAASESFSDLPGILRRGLFMVISAYSTTGFQNITTNELTTVFTSGAFLVLAIVMAVGGGSGSTSGGIKVMRVGIMFKSIASAIKERISPDSARVAVSYNHVGRRMLSPEVVKEAMTIFVLFVVTYAIGALAGIACGYDATRAIFESVAMTSNGGITTGIAASGMPVPLELVYIFQMWAGRLEFVTLLALIAKVVVSVVPRSWTKRKPRQKA